MRQVIWEDEKGWKHCSSLREQDPDENAPLGLPCDPPDINALDWEGIKRDIHNHLINRGIVDWESLMLSQERFDPIILMVLRPRLLELYKQAHRKGELS